LIILLLPNLFAQKVYSQTTIKYSIQQPYASPRGCYKDPNGPYTHDECLAKFREGRHTLIKGTPGYSVDECKSKEDGEFETFAACEAQRTAGRYTLIKGTPGYAEDKCEKKTDGEFATFAECEAKLTEGRHTLHVWSIGPATCGKDPNGEFASYSDCQAFINNVSQSSPAAKKGELCDPSSPNPCTEGYACTRFSDTMGICEGSAATHNPPPCANKSFDNNGNCPTINTAIGPIDTDPAGFIKSVFGLLLGVAGGIAVVLIIISGYRLMASQGNPEQVQGAREMLTSAIVGLLFIIFSFVILQIIGVSILQIPGFG